MPKPSWEALHAGAGAPSPRGWWAQGSVLVDAEEPHAVELGQLGQEDAEQGGRVDHEVRGVVLGVEAGEEVPGGREGGHGLFCAALLPRGQGRDFWGGLAAVSCIKP